MRDKTANHTVTGKNNSQLHPIEPLLCRRACFNIVPQIGMLRNLYLVFKLYLKSKHDELMLQGIKPSYAVYPGYRLQVKYQFY